jgi:hypothetical protein
LRNTKDKKKRKTFLLVLWRGFEKSPAFEVVTVSRRWKRGSGQVEVCVGERGRAAEEFVRVFGS